MADHRNGKPSDSKAAGASGTYSIHVNTFTMRLKLYSNWSEQKSDLWDTSDALEIATPPTLEDLRYLKSSALNIWLLGYEFPEIIMDFMENRIHIMCSQKKVYLLEVVKQPSIEVVGVEIVMHVKAKNDSGTAQMLAIFRAIRGQSKDTPVVGYIAREVAIT